MSWKRDRRVEDDASTCADSNVVAGTVAPLVLVRQFRREYSDLQTGTRLGNRFLLCLFEWLIIIYRQNVAFNSERQIIRGTKCYLHRSNFKIKEPQLYRIKHNAVTQKCLTCFM